MRSCYRYTRCCLLYNWHTLLCNTIQEHSIFLIILIISFSLLQAQWTTSNILNFDFSIKCCWLYLFVQVAVVLQVPVCLCQQSLKLLRYPARYRSSATWLCNKCSAFPVGQSKDLQAFDYSDPTSATISTIQVLLSWFPFAKHVIPSNFQRTLDIGSRSHKRHQSRE